MDKEKKIRDIKKMLEHYFSEQLGEGASQDIAEEIYQLFDDECKICTYRQVALSRMDD